MCDYVYGIYTNNIMGKVSVKIKNIKIDKDKLIIETLDFSREEKKYYVDIIKGSVQCEILGPDNKILPLSYLENDDLIQLELDNDLMNKPNKINKIFVNFKYDFHSDSSENNYY